jgi:hypothetical protein
MEITIGVDTLVLIAGCILFVMLILQLIGAAYIHNELPKENKPLGIYWELFLWISFGTTTLGIAICAGLRTYLG